MSSCFQPHPCPRRVLRPLGKHTIVFQLCRPEPFTGMNPTDQVLHQAMRLKIERVAYRLTQQESSR